MNLLKCLIILAVLTLSAGCQKIKNSTLTERLTEVSTTLKSQRATLESARQLAIQSFNAQQQKLSEQINQKQKELTTDLEKDPKYKDRMLEIEGIQKQVGDAQTAASNDFNQKNSELQLHIIENEALVKELVEVIKKENKLPPGSTYDSASQKWDVKKK